MFQQRSTCASMPDARLSRFGRFSLYYLFVLASVLDAVASFTLSCALFRRYVLRGWFRLATEHLLCVSHPRLRVSKDA